MQTYDFELKCDFEGNYIFLYADENTRFKYEILGINDRDMDAINAIGNSVDREYLKVRMDELFHRAEKVCCYGMLSDTYEDNLILIDSKLPEIYGNFILVYYALIPYTYVNCEILCKILEYDNPLGYRKNNIYTCKIKKMLYALAHGMMPKKEWDGCETEMGGYAIVNGDGEVISHSLYNRNFFEEYLLKNTTIDRPSASKFDYAYIYKENGHYFIDLNIQIRFKSIKAGNKITDSKDKAIPKRVMEYVGRINKMK